MIITVMIMGIDLYAFVLVSDVFPSLFLPVLACVARVFYLFVNAAHHTTAQHNQSINLLLFIRVCDVPACLLSPPATRHRSFAHALSFY